MIPGSLGVIPARLESFRLPRKPLLPLLGRPLIEWVWRRVVDANLFESLVVATDSPEVVEVVHGFGGHVELTSSAHPSGTDRVAEVAQKPRFRSFPLIVNIQGDEPFIRGADLAAAAALVSEADWPVGTLAAPIFTEAEFEDPAVVKVVRGERGQALYFSRAPIPYPREAGSRAIRPGDDCFLRHLGVYAYSREALLRWIELPECVIERVERLEQLRPLVAGIGMGVAVVPPGEAGVDTPADAERAELFLRGELERGASTAVMSWQ